MYEWHRREKKKGNWKKKKKRWKSIRRRARSESFIFICVSSLEDLYIMDRMWYLGNRGQKYLLSQTGECCLCFEWPQELVMWIIRFLRELWGRWNAMLFFLSNFANIWNWYTLGIYFGKIEIIFFYIYRLIHVLQDTFVKSIPMSHTCIRMILIHIYIFLSFNLERLIFWVVKFVSVTHFYFSIWIINNHFMYGTYVGIICASVS